MAKRKATGEYKLFLSIWEERIPKSFLTKKPLRENVPPGIFVSYFAHVLPKGKYPGARLDKDNIILLTPYEHNLLDQGAESDRKKYEDRINNTTNYSCDWNKIYKLREKLKEKYN